MHNSINPSDNKNQQESNANIHSYNNNSNLTPHHSFNVVIAQKLNSIELAILIHHFMYWINFNQNMNKNFHEGKFWTYQTYQEIQAHFPYWSYDQIKRLLKKLKDLGILIAGNFNKKSYDQTIWYTLDFEKLSNVQNRPIDRAKSPDLYDSRHPAKSPDGSGEIARPIPHTKPNNKAYEYIDLNVPTPDGVPVDASDEAQRLNNLFIEKLFEIKPDRKITESQKQNWHKTFDKMLRLDKRSAISIEKLINWLSTSTFWSTNIASADSFRKQFDRIEMQSSPKKSDADMNRDYVYACKKAHPKELSTISVSGNYVIQLDTSKELPFSSFTHEAFKKAFHLLVGAE